MNDTVSLILKVLLTVGPEAAKEAVRLLQMKDVKPEDFDRLFALVNKPGESYFLPN